MTARANVVGKRSDGSVRRYGLEISPGATGQPGRRLVHVLATDTGKLAYCGFEPRQTISPTLAQALQIEGRRDPRVKGFQFCTTCLDGLMPQPDPAIWGPKRANQPVNTAKEHLP